MSMQLHLTLHGTGAAFWRKPGCPCDRCQPPVVGAELSDLLSWEHQAHTAASLVITEDGVAIDHTLIDCGQGVVPNLVGLDSPARGVPLNRVLVTHGHFDHIAGLDGLLHGIQMNRKAGDWSRAAQPWPLPIFATRQTWERTIGANPTAPEHGGHFRYMLDVMHHVDVTPAARAQQSIQLHPALSVQPIPVEHYLDSVHYRFTFWPSGAAGQGQPVHLALCWDLMAYPAGRPADVWRSVTLHPGSGWLHEQMTGLDLLVIEMTTWRGVNGGHLGFLGPATTVAAEPGAYGVRALVEQWRPRMTRVVHYDGWDDRQQSDGTWSGADVLRGNTDPARGPVRDGALRVALRAALSPGLEIDVGVPNATITLG